MAVTYVLNGTVLQPGQQAFAGLRDVTGDLVEFVIDTPDGPLVAAHAELAPGGGLRARFSAPQHPGRYAFRWIIDGVDSIHGTGAFTVEAPEPGSQTATAGGAARVVAAGHGARIVR